MVARWEKDPAANTLAAILVDVVAQFGKRAAERHVKTPEAYVLILDELDNLWRMFVRRLPADTVRIDGFEMVIREQYPDAFKAWQMLKQMRSVRKEAERKMANASTR